MNISDAFKLTVLRFLNSAGVILIVNSDSTQWYNGANLVYDATVLIMIIILNPLWQFINIFELVKFFRIKTEKSKGNDCELTQLEANELCEAL